MNGKLILSALVVAGLAGCHGSNGNNQENRQNGSQSQNGGGGGVVPGKVQEPTTNGGGAYISGQGNDQGTASDPGNQSQGVGTMSSRRKNATQPAHSATRPEDQQVK